MYKRHLCLSILSILSILHMYILYYTNIVKCARTPFIIYAVFACASISHFPYRVIAAAAIFMFFTYYTINILFIHSIIHIYAEQTTKYLFYVYVCFDGTLNPIKILLSSSSAMCIVHVCVS